MQYPVVTNDSGINWRS